MIYLGSICNYYYVCEGYLSVYLDDIYETDLFICDVFKELFYDF